MEFNTKVGSVESIKADCIAVGVHAGGALSGAAKRLDVASKGALQSVLKSGDFAGKRGSTVMLRQLAGIAATRVVMIGLGKREDFADRHFQDAVRTAVKTAGPAVRTLLLCATDWMVGQRDHRWQALQTVLAAREATFRADEMKSKKDHDEPALRQVSIALERRDAAVERGLLEGGAIANGMALTKRLGNLPGNVCTPSFLGTQARGLARSHGLAVQVMDQRQIEALKMGSFLSVSRGSDEPPRLIVMRHNGAGVKAAPVVLVGKGITFDTGGISIKPAAAMDEMKYDMGGAAAVMGAMVAAAELKLKLNIIGVVPTCENMPSGRAIKPGDIVTSMSGQTIEILNTDAEGRLILCDALTYVERFKPAAVVDIATLTGACVVALGNVNSGLFSSDDGLADELSAAGRTMVDPAWRMPIDANYDEQLKSNFADMANIGSPGNAGACVAAAFLARFTKAYRWAHLDVAGTAWKSGGAKGATGRPVPLLAQFLIGRAG